MKRAHRAEQADNTFTGGFDLLLGGYSTFFAAIMLTASSHYYVKGIELIANKYDLSFSRLITIWLLYISGIPLTATQLSHLIMIEPHAVSRMLDKLEKQKLIKRMRSKDDRRNWHVSLTPKGRELTETAFPEVSNLAEHVFGKALSKNELQSFIASSEKVRNACYKWLGGDLHDFRDDETLVVNALRAFPEYRT